VLLHSDTDKKPVTSITAVLFPFVTYLLTLPRFGDDNIKMDVREMGWRGMDWIDLA
jgi:hypothetical protein